MTSLRFNLDLTSTSNLKNFEPFFFYRSLISQFCFFFLCYTHPCPHGQTNKQRQSSYTNTHTNIPTQKERALLRTCGSTEWVSMLVKRSKTHYLFHTPQKTLKCQWLVKCPFGSAFEAQKALFQKSSTQFCVW